MKKTKVVCTMGPNTNDRELMRKLIENGMDVARFNFSHGDHEEQKGRMDLLKELRAELHTNTAILLDTKGPEIRTGVLKDGKKITLETGAQFTLTVDEIVGDQDRVSITYDGLVQDVDPGKLILIDDGLIGLKVISKTERDILCEVVNGGELGEKKGVNVPNVAVRLPAITEKDKDDIRFGVEQGIDFIAASFVRNAECVLEIKAYLKELGAPFIPIIAKIENAEGIKNIDEIIRAADGIMVARGDLGVEIPAEEVPYLQKMLIQKCNSNFKTVITATQMLDSMMRNPRPTRAEVTDVANAVYDGTDAVMLSGETAQGKYPLEALQMMVHIIESTEQHLDYETMLDKTGGHLKRGLDSAVGYSSVLAASNLNAKCIITPSVSGATTRVVSNLRPRQLILGVTPNERTLRRMSIYWGVVPIKSREFNTTDDICDGAIELAKVKQYVETGDVVVLTTYPTPFHLYDEKGIRENVKALKEAFAWNEGYKEYFAVKATPNPFLIQILKEYGCGCDCSSYTELMLSDAVDIRGEDIMFSSNDTPAEDFALAAKLGAIINLDDITHIDFLEKTIGYIPETISCRYNPGGLFKISNDIMDNPGDAKYGMTTEQILEAYKILKSKGAKEFGLHAFLASNTVTNDYYPMLAKVLFEQAVRLSKEAGVHIKFINLSGGIGIPYRPDQEPNDIRAIGEGVRKVYEEVLVPAGMGDVAIYTELGRYMMGPYGCLVTKAIHEKHTHKDYIGVDACAVNLMRPAMYGAYHHITVLGKEDAPCDRKYDVTGSLCENNDKFAIDRMLPEIEIGDYLVIHDTGAHGFAMGYNYNGKLKSAELLLKEDGSVQLIRRAEKPSDYFATFDCFEIGKKLLGK